MAEPSSTKPSADGRTIVIFSTKGGVGKSVVAANLAVAISQSIRKPVCLIDLDVLGMGDLSKMLGLSVQRSMVDLMSFLKRQLPPEQIPLDDIIQPHSSGVHLIQALISPRQLNSLDPSTFPSFFSAIKARYPFIIVDAGKTFTDHLIATLDESNLVLLVLTPDIVSLYQTKWAMSMIESLLFPSSMVKAVINRAESRGGVGSKDVRVAMPCDVVGEIPSDGRAIGSSINQGLPVAILYSQARVAESFRQLANTLVTSPGIYVSRKEIPRHQRPKDVMEGHGVSSWSSKIFRDVSTEEASELEDEIVRLKKQLHERLVEELNLKSLDLALMGNRAHMRDLREKCEKVINNLLSREMGGIVSSHEVRLRLVKEIADEALALGPLEELLADTEISDILVNNKDQIYIERKGRLELTSKKFVTNDQVRAVIERIVTPLGRRIDESSPMVDARLPDGSRVNAIIPPLSVKGPVLSIRKFVGVRYSEEDLIRLNSLNKSMADFINMCVVGKRNIIISGGTGSGKTTTLNIVSAHIPSDERIITIEDAAELRLSQAHWVSLEARPQNVEGKGQISIRDLFRNALRMRPDRIIIGECRSAESLDMLQAMNTGHDGSLTTIHANSPRDVVSRLDSMVLMSNIDLPVRAIREMIASAIHLVIHTARLSDGSRKVTSITEFTGLENETDVAMRELFRFRQTGISSDGIVLGDFVATGNLPTFFNEIKVKGISIDESLFQPPS